VSEATDRSARIELPRLRHCTFLRPEGTSRMTMIVGREFFEITEVVGDLDAFLRVKSYFDGRHPIGEIATRTGVPVTDVRAIAEHFDDLGLLRREESLDRVPIGDFLDRVEAAASMWRRQIGYHPLFQVLQTGAARPEVFIGLLIETYHYVRSASDHMAVAVAHCSEERWRAPLVRYLVDEHDHGPLVLKALVNVGVSPVHAGEAHPLIGTMSLVDRLSDIARRSTLAYLACTTLFETGPEEFEEAKASFEAMAEANGVAADLVAPVIEHLAGDVAAGHRSLLRDALAHDEHLEASSVHDIVNRMHDLKHSFDQYHDGILQYYSDISNYIPRVRVDYFSL
jgi:pyrroloquinoline quinone (PQQ) biosynthesis protein C